MTLQVLKQVFRPRLCQVPQQVAPSHLPRTVSQYLPVQVPAMNLIKASRSPATHRRQVLLVLRVRKVKVFQKKEATRKIACDLFLFALRLELLNLLNY